MLRWRPVTPCLQYAWVRTHIFQSSRNTLTQLSRPLSEPTWTCTYHVHVLQHRNVGRAVSCWNIITAASSEACKACCGAQLFSDAPLDLPILGDYTRHLCAFVVQLCCRPRGLFRF